MNRAGSIVTTRTKQQIPVPRCSARAVDVADIGKIGIPIYKESRDESLSFIYKKPPKKLWDLNNNYPK